MRPERGRDNDDIRAGRVCADVERETGTTDTGREQRANAEVATRLRPVDADGA